MAAEALTGLDTVEVDAADGEIVLEGSGVPAAV